MYSFFNSSQISEFLGLDVVNPKTTNVKVLSVCMLEDHSRRAQPI